MSYSLKNHYFSRAFTEQLAGVVQEVYSPFDRERFIALVHDGEWEARELKARMRHLTHCLHATLPQDYPAALEILRQAIPSLSVRLGPCSKAKAEELSKSLDAPSSGKIRIEESGTYNGEAAWWIWVEGMEKVSSLNLKP